MPTLAASGMPHTQSTQHTMRARAGQHSSVALLASHLAPLLVHSTLSTPTCVCQLLQQVQHLDGYVCVVVAQQAGQCGHSRAVNQDGEQRVGVGGNLQAAAAAARAQTDVMRHMRAQPKPS